MGTSDAGDKIPGLDEAFRVGGAGPDEGQVKMFKDGKEQCVDSPGTQVQRYADKAMFEAKPMTSIEPKVHLLWMTPDPLGAVAAATKMYKGEPVFSLGAITDAERKECWEINHNTSLNAPLETIYFHWMIEGVDRAFTHQLVRIRTGVFFQESMRFAVKENLVNEVPVPVSFKDGRVATNQSAKNDLNDHWQRALTEVDRSYKALIAAGVPAEDARGLLPTATLTRIQFGVNLRNLIDHAGNRLCTQAQFHWKSVFTQMRECIRTFPIRDCMGEGTFCYTHERENCEGYPEVGRWQFEAIADSDFVPKCYQQGKCTFDSSIDRGCTIRPRVDAFARNGVPSSEWEKPYRPFYHADQPLIEPIKRAEWEIDPQAGWVR